MNFDFKRKDNILILIIILSIVFGLGSKVAKHPLTSPYEESLVLEKQDGERESGRSQSAENEGGQSKSIESEFLEAETGTVQSFVYVHIAGAVEKPGVYCVPEGTRVAEAINLAIPQAKADINLLNLAEMVLDQQQIIVPKEGELLNATGTGSATTGSAVGTVSGNPVRTNSSTKINLNSATLEQLDSLPGIGPAYAQRIIDYRKSNGGFRDIQQLKKVKGIGDKLFAKIKDRVSV